MVLPMREETYPMAGDRTALPLERASPDTPLLSSRRLQWDSVTVEQFRLPPRDLAFPPLTEHTFIYVLDPAVPMRQQRGGQIVERVLAPGAVLFLPAHEPSHFHWMGEANVVHVRLDPVFVTRVAEASDLDPARIELLHEFGTHDRHIEHLSLALRDEIAHGGLGQRLYIDSLVTTATIHLLRAFTTRAPLPVHVPGVLPRRQLQDVHDFIDDHLAHQLHLADLAARVGLSPYHFSRVFKRTTGQSPHHYVLARRVARATLLTTTTLPIADVALRVGFTDQSHLTYHLKRVVGLTPRHLRHTARIS
jgi:AraC family transcriptional regulator